LIAGASLASAQAPTGGSTPSVAPSSPSAGSAHEGGGSSGKSSQGSAAPSGAQKMQPSGHGRDAAESSHQGRDGKAAERDHEGRPQRQGQSGEGKSKSNQAQTGRHEKSERPEQTTGQREKSDRHERTGQREPSGGKQGRSSETTGSTSSKVTVNTEQRTKIRSHANELRVGRVDNANFSISVGTRVPRSVHLHAIPSTIIEIVPAWRRYRFVLVRDEIVIIDPDTFEIVAVIDA
jgi:hypothetical protein